jgi:hypothetical protein
MTYACPVWEFAADIYLLKVQRLQEKFFKPLEIFEGAHWSAIGTHDFQPSVCIRLYNKIAQTTNKKSYRIMIIYMFAAENKVKPDKDKYKRLAFGGGRTNDPSRG